jgi:NADPH:quinone reductase-like Zn-dependent oxidoreductase
MKAARLNEWGKPLELEDIPQPEPGPGQALVRVHAASINPFDSALQAGYLASMASVPLTLGTDFSGTVVSVGEGMDHVKPGDAVYGSTPLGSGTFAEYTLVKGHELAHKPQTLDFAGAAGVPLPTLAAWILLYEQAEFKPGDRLLIHGVAGNVGSAIVQLARKDGAYIYGTDIDEKRQHILGLGLDRFIDSGTERFEDIVEDVDAVIDLVGGDLTQRSYSILKPGKRYATSMVMEPEQEQPRRLGITSRGLGAFPRLEILQNVARLIDAGKLKTFVNRSFPLEQVNEALAYRMQTTVPGKVIVTLQ